MCDTLVVVCYFDAKYWRWAYELGNVMENYVSGVSQISRNKRIILRFLFSYRNKLDKMPPLRLIAETKPLQWIYCFYAGFSFVEGNTIIPTLVVLEYYYILIADGVTRHELGVFVIILQNSMNINDISELRPL